MYDAIPAEDKPEMAAQYFITAAAPYPVFVLAFNAKLAEQLKARFEEVDDSFVQMGKDNPHLVVKRLLTELQGKVDEDLAALQLSNVPDAAVVSEYAAAKAGIQQMKDNLALLSPAGMSEGLPPGMDIPNPEAVFNVLIESYDTFVALCDKVTDAVDNDAAAAVVAAVADNDDLQAQQGKEVETAETLTDQQGEESLPAQEDQKDDDAAVVVVADNNDDDLAQLGEEKEVAGTLTDQQEEGLPPTQDDQKDDAAAVSDDNVDDEAQQGKEKEVVETLTDELAATAIDSSGEAQGDEPLIGASETRSEQQDELSPPTQEQQEELSPPPQEGQENDDAAVVAAAGNDDNEAQQGKEVELKVAGTLKEQQEEGSSPTREDQKDDDAAVAVGDNDDNEAQQSKEPQAGATATLTDDLAAAVVDEATKENENSAVVVVVAVDGDIVVEQLEPSNGDPPVPVLEDASVKGSDTALPEPTDEVSLLVADKLIEEVADKVVEQIRVEQEEKADVPLLEVPVAAVTSMTTELTLLEASSQPHSTHATTTQPTSSPIDPLTTASAIIAPPKNNLPSEAEREALLATLDLSNPRFLRYAPQTPLNTLNNLQTPLKHIYLLV